MGTPVIKRPKLRYIFNSDEYDLRNLPPGEYEIKRSEDDSMEFVKIGDLWFNCTT